MKTLKYVPYIPVEILDEIFKHLPVESLFKFQCTSKAWLQQIAKLIKDLPAEKEYERRSKEHRFLCRQFLRLQLKMIDWRKLGVLDDEFVADQATDLSKRMESNLVCLQKLVGSLCDENASVLHSGRTGLLKYFQESTKSFVVRKPQGNKIVSSAAEEIQF